MAPIITWNKLPADVRLLLLQAFLQNVARLSHLAAVSREWQTFNENHNFARLKLTPSCLTEFASKTRRNRHVVDYIWYCVELEEYDDDLFHSAELFSLGDVNRVATAIRDLFAVLSTWAPTPTGKLLLDISVYSLSDPEYRFQELTLVPDTPHTCGLHQCLNEILSTMFEKGAGQYMDHENSRLFPDAKGTFAMVGLEGYVEPQWWQHLPQVPAVTGILLRQQTRRQWSPFTLAQLFDHLPRLQEIYLEPWRGSTPNAPCFTDEGEYSPLTINCLTPPLSNISCASHSFQAAVQIDCG